MFKKHWNYKLLILLLIVVLSIVIILFLWKKDIIFNNNSLNEHENMEKINSKTNLNETTWNGPSAFYVSHIYKNFGTVCIFEKPSEYEKASIGLMGMVRFAINADSGFSSYEGDRVSFVSVSNFEITQKPSVGTLVLLTSGQRKPLDQLSIQEREIPKNLIIPILKNKPTDEEVWSNYYAQSGNGQISIMYCVKDIGDISGSDKYTNLLPSIQKLKLSSDNLRSSISFDIEVKTLDNQLFKRHMEVKMIEGEFLKENNEVTSVDLNYETEKLPLVQIK